MVSRDEITMTEAELREARQRGDHLSGLLGFVGTVLAAAMNIPAAMIAYALFDGWVRFPATGGFAALFGIPFALSAIRMAKRQAEKTAEIMEALRSELTEALESAEHEASRRDVQARRQEFETSLANALEMAANEPEVIDVVERAFDTTLPTTPAELLLADNSHAHLIRMASSAADEEAPMCGVDSPDQCPAARRAQVQRFADSEALDACPKLRGRPHGRCAAVCVPVSIMGRTVGVIHAMGEVGTSFDDSAVADLGTLANLAGARVGLLRMMADTQLQAATDSLTGLLNRRSFENEVRAVRDAHDEVAVVMADLDHFKQLNDTYGHDTGDRALRLFAQTLRSSLRSQDIVCRYGGEEFAVVMPSCLAADASRALELVRAAMAGVTKHAGLPVVTASFGVVDAHPGEDLVHALARADAALFEAKVSGRDRVVVHATPTSPVPSLVDRPTLEAVAES